MATVEVQEGRVNEEAGDHDMSDWAQDLELVKICADCASKTSTRSFLWNDVVRECHFCRELKACKAYYVIQDPFLRAMKFVEEKTVKA